MPNVLPPSQTSGIRLMVFLNDGDGVHGMHVHAFTAGSNIVVRLEETRVAFDSYDGKRPTASTIRKALVVVARHYDACEKAWKALHR